MPRQNKSHVDAAERLGARLRQARSAAGLRLRDVAFEGCSLGYVSHIERGNRVPSLQVIRELARRVGVSEQWLATGSHAVSRTHDDLLDEAETALRFDDVATAATLFEQATSAGGSAQQQARIRAGLGQLAFRRDDAHGAVEHFEAALELDQGLESDDSFSDSLGRAYAQTGEMEMAVALFRRRLADAKAGDRSMSRVRFSVLLANALVDLSSFAEASEVLGDVLTESAGGDPLMLARLQWAQSRLHAMKGETELASRYARKALNLLEATEFTQYRSRAHHLLAFIEIDAGNYREALELIEQGRDLARCGGTAFDVARFDLEEARARAALGELSEASLLVSRAAAELANHHPFDVGRCYAELASITAEAGELHRARELYELALEYLEGGPNRALAETLRKLGALLERIGDRDAAYDVFKRGLDVAADLSARSG